MKRMTKATTAKLEMLRNQRNAAMNLIYGFAPDRNTRFSDCRKLATSDANALYESACDAVSAYERQLADDGRGWIENGYFKEY